MQRLAAQPASYSHAQQSPQPMYSARQRDSSWQTTPGHQAAAQRQAYAPPQPAPRADTVQKLRLILSEKMLGVQQERARALTQPASLERDTAVSLEVLGYSLSRVKEDYRTATGGELDHRQHGAQKMVDLIQRVAGDLVEVHTTSTKGALMMPRPGAVYKGAPSTSPAPTAASATAGGTGQVAVSGTPGINGAASGAVTQEAAGSGQLGADGAQLTAEETGSAALTPQQATKASKLLSKYLRRRMLVQRFRVFSDVCRCVPECVCTRPPGALQLPLSAGLQVSHCGRPVEAPAPYA